MTFQSVGNQQSSWISIQQFKILCIELYLELLDQTLQRLLIANTLKCHLFIAVLVVIVFKSNSQTGLCSIGNEYQKQLRNYKTSIRNRIQYFVPNGSFPKSCPSIQSLLNAKNVVRQCNESHNIDTMQYIPDLYHHIFCIQKGQNAWIIFVNNP